MRVEVNRDRCESYGVCESVAPAVFQINEADVLVLLPCAAGEVDRATLQRAVDGCPKDALSIID